MFFPYVFIVVKQNIIVYSCQPKIGGREKMDDINGRVFVAGLTLITYSLVFFRLYTLSRGMTRYS
jgi:hypothetical protein